LGHFDYAIDYKNEENDLILDYEEEKQSSIIKMNLRSSKNNSINDFDKYINESEN